MHAATESIGEHRTLWAVGRASAQRRVGDVAGRLGRWSYRFVRDIIDDGPRTRRWPRRRDRVLRPARFLPALIVLAAALGSADGILGTAAATDIETWLVDQVTTVLGGDNNVEGVVRDLFASDNGSAFTVGAVLAAYAASRGFTAVVRALDVAYDHEQRRNWLSTRIVGIGLTAMTIVVAAIVLMLIVVGPLFGEGAELAERLGVDGWFTVLWTWFRWPVVFLALIGWAASLYNIAEPSVAVEVRASGCPAGIGVVDRRVARLRHLPRACVTWCKRHLRFSRRRAESALWLYLMAMGLLLGAEVNSIIATRRGVIFEAVPRERLDRWVKRALRR